MRRIYTWKMPGENARYQIDYILVKNRFKNQVKFGKTYPSADCDSDHNIVIVKCEFRYKKPQRT
jgi:exonuclease III